MKAIGMHVFAGAFTLGMRKHHDVLMHLEDGEYGVDTVRKNQPDVQVHTDPSDWPVDALIDEGVDIVYGNPPCAPFSNSSMYRARADDPLDDPRVECIRQMIDVLERVQPRFWVFESVTQAYKNGGVLLERVERTAQRLGYNVTHFLHDVNYYGHPQRRKRYFCIVHDTPLRFKQPEWDSAPTVGDMLGEITIPEERRRGPYRPSDWRWDLWKEIIPDVPPGGSLRDAFEARWPGVSKGRPMDLTKRLDPDAPSLALMGHFRFIHPTEDRFLTANEHARLQGFPADYEFTPTTQPAMCDEASRGVCTGMGDYIGAVFADAEHRAPEQQGVMVVDFREPPGRIIFAKTFD